MQSQQPLRWCLQSSDTAGSGFERACARMWSVAWLSPSQAWMVVSGSAHVPGVADHARAVHVSSTFPHRILFLLTPSEHAPHEPSVSLVVSEHAPLFSHAIFVLRLG